LSVGSDCTEAAGSGVHVERRNSLIFRRIAASGIRPSLAPMFWSRWAGTLVAGIAQVTAGCAITHFRKNCAQFSQSIASSPTSNDEPGAEADQRERLESTGNVAANARRRRLRERLRFRGKRDRERGNERQCAAAIHLVQRAGNVV